MPVPVHADSAHVSTPGQVEPPLDVTGVTELRVHGVGGTTPAALLGDLSPQQVAGNGISGFYRTADARGRHVEAYSWGGFTSRSATRVLWLLLLPFLLANLAGWMCDARVARSRRLGWCHRAAVRIAALGVTLNVVLLLAATSMDVVGYQCGAQPTCRVHWYLLPLRWSFVGGHPARRVLFGAVLPLLLIAVLAVVSARSRRRYESVLPPTRFGAPPSPGHASAAALPAGLADPDFWDGAPAARRLGRLHLAGALALVALLVVHTVRTSAASAGALRWGGVSVPAYALAGLVLVGVLVGLSTERGQAVAAALLGAGFGAVLLAAGLAWAQPAWASPPGELPGIRNAMNASFGGVFAALGLVLLVVVVSTARGGHERGTFWIGAPFVVLGLAIVLLNAVLLGVLIRVADLFGSVWFAYGGPRRTGIYVFPVIARAAPWLTLAPIVVIVVFGLVEYGQFRRAARRHADAVVADYRGEAVTDPMWMVSALPADGPVPPWQRRQAAAWPRSVARMRRFAVIAPDFGRLLTGIVVVGVGVLGFAEYQIWLQGRLPTPWLITTGTAVASALPVIVLGLLRSGWHDLEKRRRLGVLWDVGTFWPRCYHPLAPPSYAERAVPELQRRLWWLHDHGGKVLLTCHSQGTILGAAALAQHAARPPGASVALVTFGSPLRKLYHWAFPAYFTAAVLGDLRVSAWRNFSYDTDPIGGRIGEPTVDVRLKDPRTAHYAWGQPLPPVRGHSGYWSDPAMWSEVDELAADLAAAEPTPPGPTAPGPTPTGPAGAPDPRQQPVPAPPG
jgi:hypothetical protein